MNNSLLSHHTNLKFQLREGALVGWSFERLDKSAKCCFQKVIGMAHLLHDELLTVVTEVEAILNLRPLTYVSSEDVEEPLTPSHLMLGYQMMSCTA